MATNTLVQRLERWSTFSQIERFYVLEREPNNVQPATTARFELHRSWSVEFQRMLDAVRGEPGDDRARIVRGHSCAMAFVNDEPACFGWASPTNWGGAGVQQPLAIDANFSYDVMTSPRFRGLRLAPALLAFKARRLRDLGFPRSLTTVRDTNVASQNSIRKVGYVRTEHTVRVYRMRLMSILQSGGPPPSFLP